MKEGFRHSMAWLHTWGGLLFGWLLFAVFITGSLGVFDEAISRWMGPPAQATAALSSEQRMEAVRLATRHLEQTAAHSPFWGIRLPGEGEGSLRLAWRDGVGQLRIDHLDPLSGTPLPATAQRESDGGHHFVHMHFQLQAGTFGIWLVGLATVALLVALISGVVVHKRIFKDFFTFRPAKGQRSWLDGHNAAGVLTLPFQLMIAYSGLVVFYDTYMPAAIAANFHDVDHYEQALLERPGRPARQGVAAPLLPLECLLAVGETRLGREARFLVLSAPGDAGALVRIFGRPLAEDGQQELVVNSGVAAFKGATGEALWLEEPGLAQGGGALLTQQVMVALHFVRFGGYPLKWLYFVSGLVGAVLIATGLVLFSLKRRKRQTPEFGAATASIHRLIEALNVAAVAGISLACIAFFWINRLLPTALEQRAEWEISLFFAVWALSLPHALLRPPLRAWWEQLGLAALLCLTLPLINAITTGDQLLAALARGDGARAGVELVAVAIGLLLAWLAWQLRRRQRLAMEPLEVH